MDKKRILHKLRILREFIAEGAKYALLYPVGRLIYGGKDVWLVAERGTDARDNGYHLFRYIREKHPEKKAYYVISEDAPDYAKMAKLGNIVPYRSLRHYLLFFGAKSLVSTHVMGMAPDRNFYQHMMEKRHKRLVKGKLVFLQHGITKDWMPQFVKENAGLDLFVCGAKPEYEYIRDNYHYTGGEVQYTGFARYDNLASFQLKRQVLIMPTWRDWLIYGAGVTRSDVENSPYVCAWNGFLKNPALAEMAKKYDLRFVFYPHPMMQRYIEVFEGAGEHVVIASQKDYDVQQLLKESMLLVTDYSSVFFDFGYMRKPVLHYQFDEAEYRARQYEQGYFDYRENGFGPVTTREDELLGQLEDALAGKCRLKMEYAQRIEGFFPLRDTKNCERIYNEIAKL